MKSKVIDRFFFITIFSLLLLSCQEGPSQTEPPYDGPPKGHIITVERAQEMYDAYSQRRVPIIKEYEDSITSGTKMFSPTRYAEYDLKTIKQYIAYIEHEAKQANVDINTLRIYLSNYPKSTNYPNGDAVKYPRQNSLFVVPTMDYNGNNVGFSIKEVDGKYNAVPIRKEERINDQNNDEGKGGPNGELNEAGFFLPYSSTLQVGTTSLIFNEGTITPPPASGTNDFGENN